MSDSPTIQLATYTPSFIELTPVYGGHLWAKVDSIVAIEVKEGADNSMFASVRLMSVPYSVTVKQTVEQVLALMGVI